MGPASAQPLWIGSQSLHSVTACPPLCWQRAEQGKTPVATRAGCCTLADMAPGMQKQAEQADQGYSRQLRHTKDMQRPKHQMGRHAEHVGAMLCTGLHSLGSGARFAAVAGMRRQATARDAVQQLLRASCMAAPSGLSGPLHAACRYIERYNNKLRQAAKKDETRRMKAFVNNAYACDPRVLRRKAEEKAERCGRTHVVMAALWGPACGCMTTSALRSAWSAAMSFRTWIHMLRSSILVLAY